MWLEEYYSKEFSYLAAIEKGRKLPAWVEEEPYLEPAEEWLLTAYGDLGTCRGVDGAIPWRDMVEYADRAGLDPDVGRAFVQIMRWVDSDKLKRHRDRAKGEHETQEAQSAPATADEQQTMPTASKESMLAAARRRAANVKKV